MCVLLLIFVLVGCAESPSTSVLSTPDTSLAAVSTRVATSTPTMVIPSSTPTMVIATATATATASSTLTPTVPPTATPVTEAIDVSAVLGQEAGCFVLFDLDRNHYLRSDQQRCAKRLSPCSTFKIAHTLIGLDSGVLTDQQHLMPWDGTAYAIPTWNQDHTLASAFRNSVVWYYQSVATRIGEARMARYLQTLSYGNADSSGNLTDFWLDSSLLISADEQIDFLTRLDRDELPVAPRARAIVQELMELPAEPGTIYRGKTGSCRDTAGRGWGWFVGSFVHDQRTYIFATNIEGSRQATGQRARMLTEQILTQRGLR